MNTQQETIVVGGGCFWCLDAVFRRLQGVLEVESGYAGGTMKNPGYYDVVAGRTGHAEVVQVLFNPEVVSLEELLQIFFTLHDPTTLNRQGADVGTQYRSIILYTTDKQREVAQKVMEEFATNGVWEDSIVTELVPLEEFYAAEDDQQRFYEKYTNQAYCQIVIAPKVAKLRSLYLQKLLPEPL